MDSGRTAAALPRSAAAGLRRRGLLLALPGLLATPAHAGGQLEEPLADSVRTALRAAVASAGPPELLFASTEARLSYLRWLAAMSDRLYRRKPEADVRRLLAPNL